MPGTVDYDLDDLDDLGTTIGRWKRAVPEGTEDGIRDAAETVARLSSARVATRPGGGTYRRDRNAYDVANVKDGAGVTIAGGGTAIGAEFGATRGWVFGRVFPARALSRPQYARWIRSSDGTSGYVVGRTIRDNADKVTDHVMEGADAAMRKTARTSGTKTSGKYRRGR